ncbi:DUF1885 family protein [Bacillus sp. FJAT-42376]|uniref:DUF1885 family protein n=1 Tax=Bacillus sp. FJAT-42376 TaxID=2014076 RepID=UPI000F50ED4B|nr:DUF1885 family protein [Bacillus sp. FJAT-42376]AZB42775.1 DUF1885 family protein [Bacillus sp. FJAT-42376]
MGEHASIVLNPQENVSIEAVSELIDYYKIITGKTGEQLGWHYRETAFPYEVEVKENLLYLKSSHPGFNQIIIGVADRSVIQVYLSAASVLGDKAKANELCKFLAKKMKAELHLFNGKIMRFS